MQRVINSQQSLITKIQKAIKDEFDQRKIGHSFLLIQQEMKLFIINFESKVINEINELKSARSGGSGSGSSIVSGNLIPELQSG